MRILYFWQHVLLICFPSDLMINWAKESFTLISNWMKWALQAQWVALYSCLTRCIQNWDGIKKWIFNHIWFTIKNVIIKQIISVDEGTFEGCHAEMKFWSEIEMWKLFYLVINRISSFALYYRIKFVLFSTNFLFSSYVLEMHTLFSLTFLFSLVLESNLCSLMYSVARRTVITGWLA